MEIADMFDYSVAPELEAAFQRGFQANRKKPAELQDAMNFGDIQVGVNKNQILAVLDTSLDFSYSSCCLALWEVAEESMAN